MWPDSCAGCTTDAEVARLRIFQRSRLLSGTSSSFFTQRRKGEMILEPSPPVPSKAVRVIIFATSHHSTPSQLTCAGKYGLRAYER